MSSSVVAAAAFGADLDFATDCKWSIEKMHRPLRRASERQIAEQNKPRRPLRSGVDRGRRGIADLYCTHKPRETFATTNMAIGRAGGQASKGAAHGLKVCGTFEPAEASSCRVTVPVCKSRRASALTSGRQQPAQLTCSARFVALCKVKLAA